MLGLAELTAATMTILAPYLPKAAEGFAGAVGKGAFEGATMLLKRLPSLFKGDQQAAKIVSGFETEPDRHRKDLESLLLAKIAADPGLAQELEQLVGEVKRTVSVKQDVENVDSLTGIGKAKVTKGDVRIDQNAKNTIKVIGMTDLEM